MNVQSFPRPPLLEKTSKHLQVTWNGQLIADTQEAYRVLETDHPPTYYFPPTSVRVPLALTRRRTHCEWKGTAIYFSVKAPADDNSDKCPRVIPDRIWSYDTPTTDFVSIKGYLSFSAGPWDCFVDGEAVEPQPGDFYGGWVTSDIEGIVKGGQGNLDPVL